jgi:hypothetical protein
VGEQHISTLAVSLREGFEREFDADASFGTGF